MKSTTRRRWGRVALVGALTAALTLGGLGVMDAVAKPAKPETTLPKGSSDTIRVQWKTTNKAVVAYKVRHSKSSSMSAASTSGCLPARAGAGSWSSYHWVQGLSAGTAYYFQVAAFTDASCQKQDGGWSATSDARRTAAYSYGAPGTPIVNNRSTTSLELSFTNVSGAAGYRIRYATSAGAQAMWNQVEDLALTGLKPNTEYKIKVAVAERPSRAGDPADCPLYSNLNCWPNYQQGPYSRQITVKTSAFAISGPTNVTISNQQPYSVTVNWMPPPQPVPAGYVYRIEYAKNQKMTGAKAVSNTGNDTSETITGLSSNTNYYVRVFLMRKTDAGNWVAASDRSTFQIAKTRTPFGTLAGTVQGPAGTAFDPRDVQVMVYSTDGELAKQVDAAPDGSYAAQVRPGNYRVKLTYTGSGNFVSSWAAATTRYGVPITAWSSTLAVSRSATRIVPTTTLLPGADPLAIRLTTGGAAVTGADVAVVNAYGSTREVDSVQRTDSAGRVTLRGLTVPANYGPTLPGKYAIRIVASGKATTTVWVELRRSVPADPTSKPVISRWWVGSGTPKAYTGGEMVVTMKNK